MKTVAMLAVALIVSCVEAHAQTVSIVNLASGNDAVLVEAAMKRYLRAEGYTVKSDTNEGIVLMLSLIRPENRAGTFRGLVGHVAVYSLNWQKFADLAVSGPCKEEHALAQQIKDYLGTRVIFHTANMAVAPDPDSLAEMLLTGPVNATIRETARKAVMFIEALEKERTEPSRDVLNPIR
jgi:hypothetical protein